MKKQTKTLLIVTPIVLVIIFGIAIVLNLGLLSQSILSIPYTYQETHTSGIYEVECHSDYEFGNFPESTQCTTTNNNNIVSDLSITTSGSASAVSCGIIPYSGKNTYCLIKNLEVDSSKLKDLRIQGFSSVSKINNGCQSDADAGQTQLFLYDGVNEIPLVEGVNFDVYIFRGATGDFYKSINGLSIPISGFNGKYQIGYYAKLNNAQGCGNTGLGGSSQISISSIALNNQGNQTECPTGQTKCSDGVCAISCEKECPTGQIKCSDGVCRTNCTTPNYFIIVLIIGIPLLILISLIFFIVKRARK